MDDFRIIVLDDDPTGTQTVHGVRVYTDYAESTLREAFESGDPLFFVLTNSRSFSREETIRVHREIGSAVKKLAEEFGVRPLVISRGDSTLRGHFPQETEALAEGLGGGFDGEIIMPFFPEGGRFTKDNIHYVKQPDGSLLPAGETEFARDRTFGYRSSNLCDWVEEKTGGRYKAADCLTIPLGAPEEETFQRLMGAKDFQKIIVNAMSYADVETFCAALRRALAQGKGFLYRTAAAFPRVMGQIEPIPLLRAEDICDMQSPNGGLILVGSHVPKTTAQLASLLKALPNLATLEFDAAAAMKPGAGEALAEAAATFAEKAIRSGQTAVIYTSRQRIDLAGISGEEQLAASVRVSDALTSIPLRIQTRPRYLIAKGGITSSDTATRGLRIRRADVLGQAAPGIPVWRAGKESTWTGMAYISRTVAASA